MAKAIRHLAQAKIAAEVMCFTDFPTMAYFIFASGLVYLNFIDCFNNDQTASLICWGLSGFINTTYFTFFYLWAKECEKKGSAEVELAPAPLAACLVE